VWKSILARQKRVVSKIPTLSRQLSLQPPPVAVVGAGDSGKGESARKYTLLDFLGQYLKSDTDVNPRLAEAAEIAKKKRQQAMGDDAEESSEDVKLSVNAMRRFLVQRRDRALSRITGFQDLHKLMSSSTWLSVQLEVLKYLAPALRGEDYSAQGDDKTATPAPTPGSPAPAAKPDDKTRS